MRTSKLPRRNPTKDIICPKPGLRLKRRQLVTKYTEERKKKSKKGGETPNKQKVREIFKHEQKLTIVQCQAENGRNFRSPDFLCGSWTGVAF
jgi:hypothetical protein